MLERITTRAMSGAGGSSPKRVKTQKQLEFEEEMRRPYFKDMTELARDPRKKYFEAQCFVGREQEMFAGVACAEVRVVCFFLCVLLSC